MALDLPRTPEEWTARGAAYLPGHLSMTFLAVSADEVRAELEAATRLMAWNGFLHAGTVVSLADTCCGYGTLCALPEGASGFTTLDVSSNFTGTAREGRVACRARPLHVGRSTQVWEAEVTALATGRTMAHFRCTQLTLWPRG